MENNKYYAVLTVEEGSLSFFDKTNLKIKCDEEGILFIEYKKGFAPPIFTVFKDLNKGNCEK